MTTLNAGGTVWYHSQAMRVAVVEDEAGVREAVGIALEEAGYEVESYRDGAEAWSAWGERLPELVILDIIMPRLDGLELCRRVRARSLELPVIFLSSKDEEIDRVVGLELGADDYLCKPFSVRELVARVRALERRVRLSRESLEAAGAAAGGIDRAGSALVPGAADPAPVSHALAAGIDGHSRIDLGSLLLDLDAIRVWWHGRQIPLTVTEFRLLETLVRHAGAVLSRDQLLSAAYPDDVYVTERSIDSHIRRIRRKFEQSGRAIEAISSVYGAGYRFQLTDADA